MSFTKWWRKLLHRPFFHQPTKLKKRISRQKCPSKLYLEPLEDRLAPANIITVTTLSDTVAMDGFISLREAVEAANSHSTVNEAVGAAGANQIQFAASLFTSGPQKIILTGGS